MQYIAHIRESDGKIQTVAEHLLGVRDLAETYGGKLGIRHIAGLTGMLHDLGKYTEEFKEYILAAVQNPDAPPTRGSVDHSTAGGKLLFHQLHDGKDIYKALLAEIVGNAIISHHSYLQDFLDADLESKYLNRVRDKCLPEFDQSVEHFFNNVMDESAFHEYIDQATTELKAYTDKEPSVSIEHKSMLLTKFVFSTLIDADRTNTRCFEENKAEDEAADSTELFKTYYQRLMVKIDSFQEKEDTNSPINLLRKEMSEQCDAFGTKPSGIFTLSIPTGGGKTLASLRYALKHADEFNKKHIIYVVPFTTIIEQNADEVRKILLDDGHILEHHSNVVEQENEDDEMDDGKINIRQKLKLAKDNWNSPIIFTTMVQFLNALYANGSRNIRRFHNLSESVIIFDEVQKVPVSCISLFNQAVNFLKAYAHSSIVLCTATQPELDFVKHKLEIEAEAEMINRIDDVIDAFKRVEIVDRATGEKFNNDKLAEFVKEQLDEVQSVLIILNTKGVVRDLYHKLKDLELSTPIYHLSTSMCAAHRNDILKKIKDHLSNKEPVVCISTQLIEAGVDVSFECVIRSLAGLDSMAQAAGRCNRHGEYGVKQVYVIDHEEENLDRLKEIKVGKDISKKILIDLKHDSNLHGGNLLSLQAMEKYFKEFYTDFESKLNYPIRKLRKNMTELLSAGKGPDSYYQAYCNEFKQRPPLVLASSYGTAAKHFQVIDQATTAIIVPYGEGKGEGKDIIADLNGQHSIADLTELLRKAQQYTVNVFSYGIEQLDKNNALVSYLDGKVLAIKEGAYNEEYGLNVENDSELGLNII